MNIYVICPHCFQWIEIEKINCSIFRHGVFKKNNKQINPHASQKDCQTYIDLDLIYGCGKPFKLISDNGTYQAVKCDYI